MTARQSSPRDPGREDGQAHVTPAVGATWCAHCHGRIEVRAEGRPRKYCDPICRNRAARAVPNKQRPWRSV